MAQVASCREGICVQSATAYTYDQCQHIDGDLKAVR
jgi:hypothetical protein